jgi:hypothetical protein
VPQSLSAFKPFLKISSLPTADVENTQLPDLWELVTCILYQHTLDEVVEVSEEEHSTGLSLCKSSVSLLVVEVSMHLGCVHDLNLFFLLFSYHHVLVHLLRNFMPFRGRS